jgi:hypothetical protein
VTAADGEVKLIRRLQTANARPASFISGINLSNRRMRTRLYGGVAGEERRLSPLCRFRTLNSLEGYAGRQLWMSATTGQAE